MERFRVEPADVYTVVNKTVLNNIKGIFVVDQAPSMIKTFDNLLPFFNNTPATGKAAYEYISKQDWRTFRSSHSSSSCSHGLPGI